MRKFRVLQLAILITCAFIAGCNDPAQSGGLIKVSLRQEWFPNANFAGELFAMYETDSANGLDLTLEAGSDQIDPIKLVLSGQNDFGVVSSDRILTANQSGADLVVIGVANPNSPTCFISKAENGIVTPADFQDHTIGILTGTNTEIIYRILKKKNNLDDSRLKEVEAPFELATFIGGAYDVRPAFVYDEPVSLDLQGVKYNLIKPEDYGVNFVGTVYFTTRKIVNEKPKMVQAFVNTIADGWKAAAANPQKGISYLKRFDSNIDEKRESASLAKALPYFANGDGRYLTIDYQKWILMEKDLIELSILKSSLVSYSLDSTFIHTYYAKQL